MRTRLVLLACFGILAIATNILGEATVRDAVRGMAGRDVNSVLITEEGGLAGIFTGTDLVKRVVAADLDPDVTALREVMTPDPQTVSPNLNAVEALHRMHNGRFRHLPIVDGDTVVGVVSRRDFLGYELDELERQDRLWETM